MIDLGYLFSSKKKRVNPWHMTFHPNPFIPFPWEFITLYFPLKPLVYFGHCGKAQRSLYFFLGALTLTRPIRASSVPCQGTPSLLSRMARRTIMKSELLYPFERKLEGVFH